MASMLLDEVRKTMSRRRYSIRTERSYCARVKRYVLFHKMRSRADLRGGKTKIEAFLNRLVIDLHVAPSTQNQAINTLILVNAITMESLEQAHTGQSPR